MSQQEHFDQPNQSIRRVQGPGPPRGNRLTEETAVFVPLHSCMVSLNDWFVLHNPGFYSHSGIMIRCSLVICDHRPGLSPRAPPLSLYLSYLHHQSFPKSSSLSPNFSSFLSIIRRGSSSASATDGRCPLSNLGSNFGFFELVIRFSIQAGRALGYPGEGTWTLTRALKLSFPANLSQKSKPQATETFAISNASPRNDPV